jgi:multidrug efflux system outer membrane protein
MTVKKMVLVLTAGVMLSGCSLAPDFLLPETPAPEAFKEAPADAAALAEGSWKVGEPSAQLDRGQWWKVFNDERLNDLQKKAIQENLSIQAMAARVKQARATASIAASSFLPSVDLKAGAVRQKLGAQAMGLPPGGTTSPQNQVDLGIGLSYELDFFGRVLNTSRAAKQDALATEEMLHSMVLAMQADVAEMYFNLCQMNDEKTLLQDAVGVREESLGILKKRLDAGIITELDTSQAVVELESARAQLQSVTQQYKETEHALAVLIGQAPADFALEGLSLPKDIPSVPVGLPSQLLERRPDITSAQHDLAAANARIGVARAAFFPSISLTGSGGFQSSSLKDIFDWSGPHMVDRIARLPAFIQRRRPEGE